MFEYSTYIVTMGMDMNEWLIAWIVLLKAVRAVCAPKCFNPHGNHGIAWSCSVEDYRALLWLGSWCYCRQCAQAARLGALNPDAQVIAFA